MKRSEPKPEPKFRRIAAAQRRASLIAATLQCLRQHGHEGASVRRISAAAGVSMGLINHHFPGSASLIAAAYDSLADLLLTSMRRQADEAGAQASRGRLRRFFEASFAPEVLDPGLFRIWLVFWSMVPHSQEMRAVHERTYGRYRQTLESLLDQLRREPGVPPFRIAAAAIGLSALMDGLWVELSLNPSAFRATDAIALCNDWVAALAVGAFPGLATGGGARRRSRASG